MDNINEQFEEKWNDSNIKNIMNKISNRYIKNIDFDDIESIKMNTLWKCIEKYDKNRGTKFTSYLYQQLSYAFKNKVKKKRVEFTLSDMDESKSGYTVAQCLHRGMEKQKNNYLSKIEVIDIVSDLEPEVAHIIKQRFYNNMTMKEIGKRNGYSRETARRKLKNAIKICKSICE
tara:strand:- start:127 stop:648 length:522 start_codon:yes stop_codon:yes gene_type:complete